MSLPASPAFVVNDPEHGPRGASWMRGITPARLGVIAAICLLWHWTNPYVIDDTFWVRIGKALHNSTIFFLAALPAFVVIVRTEIATSRWSPRGRIAALALAVVVGAFLFPLTRWALRFGALPHIGTPDGIWQYSFAHFFKALVVGGLLTGVLFFAAREREAQRLLQQTRLACAEIEKQMVEARLQLLQAQIEPHFLFNSLASVKRLYEKDPGKGRALLRNLGDYLRVAISRARLREAPLAEEVALARSFLAIFEVRMGARLSVRIEVPPELEGALIPPLMVGTLVENAIKHGIAPRATGGTVSLIASRRGDCVEVQVADDGVGFRVRSGHGVGLANIRARLETSFAGAGSLELASRYGGGVIATLRLPLRSAAA